MEGIFTAIASWIYGLLNFLGLPGWLVNLLMVAIYAVAIIAFVLLNVMFIIYMERKVAAYVQQRPGPNRVGPHGWLQVVADVLKLLSKEDIIPSNVDRWLYIVASLLVFVPAFMVFAVIPFGKDMVAIDLNVGLFYFISVASLGTVIVLMAGWGSNNKYSLLGGMRAVSQMVSYEIPLVFSLLGVLMLAGSLKLSDIVAAQSRLWFIVLQPVAFITYFIAATAELNRGPFDLPEGEQEIIAGPTTEYSGMRFALFYFVEYCNLVAVSALAVTLFLGGGNGPWLPSWLWFFIKLYVMIFLFMWVKWTLPRIRVDHLMQLNWKFLLPITLANVLVTGVGIKVYQLLWH